MAKQLRTTFISKRLSIVVAILMILLPYHALFTTWAGSNFGYLDIFRIWKEAVLILISIPFGLLILRDPALRAQLYMSKIIRAISAYILLFIVAGVWGLINDKASWPAFTYSLIINLRFIYFFVLCMVLAHYSSFLKNNWQKILIIPAVPVIFFGIVQKLILPLTFLTHFGYGDKTIPAFQTVDSNLNYQRVQSTLRGANPLGAYLVFIISALALWFKNIYLRLVMLATGLLTLFFTYSRSAWIGTFAALSILWSIALVVNKRTKIIMAAGIAIVSLIALSVYAFKDNQVFQDTFFHTSDSSVNVSSNQSRYNAIEQGVKDILNQPLGGSPGTAGPASFRNTEPPRISENYFIQIGQEVGVVGIAIFVYINACVCMYLWKVRNDNLAKVLLVSFAGISLVNMLSHAWADDTLSYLWWGLAGVAVSPAILKLKVKNEKK